MDTNQIKRIYNATTPVVLESNASSELTFAWFDQVIKMYESVNVEEIFALRMQNEERSKSQINKFGSNKSKNWRFALSIPTRLHTALNKVKPGWWSNKNEVNKFMKRYPLYCIPDKV